MQTRIYIDGQNFLYKASDVLISVGKIQDKNELTKIDIRGIMEGIFGEGVDIVYYGAKVRVRKDMGADIEQKTTVFSDVARRLRNTLNAQKIRFNEAGQLKVRDSDVCKNCQFRDRRMQEKGVDVGMAVDIVKDTLTKNVDRVVLVSSDTDLLPALRVAKSAGAEIVYVGFNNKTTKAIVSSANLTEIMRDQEIIDAFDRFNPPELLLVDNLKDNDDQETH